VDAARLIRETRLRHGLDQRALARRCRTSQTYISRIERGDVSPTVQTLGKLLQGMGEQLELHSVPGPRGNQPIVDLRDDFEQLTHGDRVAQAAELSQALTRLAGAARDRARAWTPLARRGSRRDPPLRALELLRNLRGHRVEFVVIGGFALAAHGCVRGTKDLDIVPEPSPANLQRLLDALGRLDVEPLAIGNSKPEEVPPLSLENLELGGNWLLRTRLGRLDVMQHVEGMRDYAELRERALAPELPELEQEVLFVGLDDLIALKRAAGRPEDLRDIAELERARGAPPP
jgi:transcriptional regulator with XRE-family HTH domain